MAVRVPEGEHTIRFDYNTPGLSTGIWVTFACAGIALLYLLIGFFYYRNKRQDALIDLELERAARLTGPGVFGSKQTPVYGPNSTSGAGSAPSASVQLESSSPEGEADAAASETAARDETDSSYLNHPGIRPANYSMDEFTPSQTPARPEQPVEDDPYAGGVTPPRIRDSRTMPSTGFSVFRPTPAETQPDAPEADLTPAVPQDSAPSQDMEDTGTDDSNVIEGFDPEQFGRFLRSIQDSANPTAPEEDSPAAGEENKESPDEP